MKTKKPTQVHGHEMFKVLKHVYNFNLGDSRAIRYIFPLPNVIGKDAASIPVALTHNIGG